MTLVDPGQDIRESVRKFLVEQLPDGWSGLGALGVEERSEFLPRWRAALLERGFLGAAWPSEFGGAGLTPEDEYALQEEFVRVGAPHLPMPNDPFGMTLIGPVLLRVGTKEQKAHFLPRILSGEYRFCQGFSEPEAGSDLFSLRTRAEPDSDGWRLTGHKTWQTAGSSANWIFVLARTEPDAGARGVSMLLVPLDQPGVVVNPIRTMTGEAEFCEVTFDNAITGSDCLVGPRGGGGDVARLLLGFERGTSSGALYRSFRTELDRLITLVVERGLRDDSDIRRRLARCHCVVETLQEIGLRALRRAATGRPPGAEASLVKLLVSTYHSTVTELAMDVLGPEALIETGPGATKFTGADWVGASNDSRAWHHYYMASRAETIYGGSSQVQRNVIAERLLSLPREPAASREVAAR